VHWIDIQVVSAPYFDWIFGTTIPDVNVTKVNGTSQTAKDLGASVTQTGDVYAKLPTNFEDMAITNTTGLVDINDKTGFSLSNAGVDAIADEPYDNDGADISLRDAIRIFLSVLCGLSTGGGTNTISFRDLLNTKNRVSMTVDVNGNRTVTITRDGT
jgi:hypothetical protein